MDYSLPSGASASTAVQQLQANQIHTVTFKGVEAKTIESKSGDKFNIMTLKFGNTDGMFEDTVFELKAGDDKRKANSYGYENPSALEELTFKIKHLLAVTNPKVAEKVEKEGLKVPGWELLTQFVIKHTQPGLGKEFQIKLVERTDSKGTKRAAFPSFVLGINKKDQVYPKTNFIGEKLVWTAKEMERIEAAKKATPSNPDSLGVDVGIDVNAPAIKPSGEVPKLDLDFDLV